MLLIQVVIAMHFMFERVLAPNKFTLCDSRQNTADSGQQESLQYFGLVQLEKLDASEIEIKMNNMKLNFDIILMLNHTQKVIRYSKKV